MFCIYGKSKILAKKTVDKLMLNNRSEVSEKLKEMQGSTQSEKQIVIDEAINEVYQEMKLKRCTHEFSTPEIAAEALALMEKDTANFSNLVMMKKKNKLTAELKKAVSKTTGKPLMEWVPVNDEQPKELAA
jgi:hypothetical protein